MVSVIVPMFNAEKSIHKTLDSILNQTYANLEVIIVDDMSTDRSLEIVKKYREKDSRVLLYRLQEKGGASIARNLAIKNSKGKYIAFLDADDTWEPNKLEVQIEIMVKNDYSFTYTNYNVYDDKNNFIKIVKSPERINYKKLLRYNSIGCLTVVYDAERIVDLEIPQLNKRNDYALWLKALQGGEQAYLIDHILANYYVSSNSLSKSSPRISLFKYHYELFNNVLKYNKVMSMFLTLRNAVLSFILK